MKKYHLLNIFNYKLFTYKNKKYLSIVDEIMRNSSFKKGITIKYLDDFIKKDNYSNNIFSITRGGKIQFLHHQNLIQFIYDKNSLPNNLKGLININIKNKLSYELIQVLVDLQKEFII